MPIKPLLAVLLALFACARVHAEPLPRVLVLTGSGPTRDHGQQYPPWVPEFQNGIVARVLSGSVEVEVSEDLSMIDAQRLAAYDLVVSNSLFLTPDAAQLEALRGFVTGGGALMTLHCGLLSFLNAPFYEDMMGGLFIGGPATVPETFEVVPGNREFWYYGYAFRPDVPHPVARVVEPFTTTDELYHFQPNDRTIEVIARAENHPVMWERAWGEGRVMSLTLGHDRRAKDNPGYRALLRAGVRWLVGYPLVAPLPTIHLDGSGPTREAVLRLADHARVRGDAPLSFALEGNDNPGLLRPSVDADGAVTLRLGEGSGRARLRFRASAPDGLAATAEAVVEVDRERRGNLARFRDVRASVSSVEARRDVMDPMYLVDGDLATRWGSAWVDEAWAMVDLGRADTRVLRSDDGRSDRPAPAVRSRVRGVHERVATVRRLSAFVAEMDAWLGSRLCERRVGSRAYRAVDQVVRALLARPDGSGLHAACASLGIGPRRLQDAFRELAGLSPRQLRGMLRFQSSFRGLQSGLPPAQLALACGYYDQAHFNREFRHYAGMSRGAWKRAGAPLNRFFLDAGSRA